MSYSSPSTTNSRPSPSRKLPPKFSNTPPISADGSRPAWVSIQATMLVVVVFPCVPVITTLCFPRRKKCSSASQNDT